MIENIIYHTIIAIFITALLIYTFHLKRAFTTYHDHFLPFLLKKEFCFPKDRSLFVRTVQELEDRLSRSLEVEVSIEIPKEKITFYAEDFHCLFELFLSEKSSKNFNKTLNIKNCKKIVFHYQNDKVQTSDSTKNTLHSHWEVRII